MGSSSTHFGDLVNGLCYTAFLPVYAWLWWASGEDPKPAGSVSVCFWFFATCLFCWMSWWRDSVVASVASQLCMSVSIVFMNLFQWPHSGEVVVLPQFLWSLVIISGNVSHGFLIKTGLALQALGMALFVAHASPLLSFSETFPSLLGATTVHVLFHYWDLASKRSAVSSELWRARFATLLLGGAFAYHVASELFKMMTVGGYALIGGFAILKVGFFASVGLAAAGAFQRQADWTKELERLVEDRTKAIRSQAEELRMAGHALQACKTAIAIADDRNRLVWTNTAFESLDLPRDTLGSFYECCNAESFKRTDLNLRGRDLSVEISPFPRRFNKDDTAGESFSKDLHFLVVVSDVTELKARDRSKEKDQLLKQAMQQSMKLWSHELLTPLQGILGVTSNLLSSRDLSVKECKESLSIVMASSRMLLNLINNVLDCNKCELEMMDEFHLCPRQLGCPMTASVEFCSPMASLMDIRLALSMDDTSKQVKVMMDSERLQRVVINFISNAIKYSPQGSTVRVGANESTYGEARKLIAKDALAADHPESQPDHGLEGDSPVVVVSVSDNGSGITEDVAEKIFSKFVQTTTQRSSVAGGDTVAQSSGTGLGLHLCAQFIRKMSGNIWVSKSTGGGACFSFYLPVVADHSGAEDRLRPPEKTTPKGRLTSPVATDVSCASSFSSYLRVLVVDDTVLNLKVLDRILKRMGLVDVTSVDSGPKALDLVEKVDFDLVITDIQMPEMTGMEVSQAISRIYGAKDTGRRHAGEASSTDNGGQRHPPIVVGLSAAEKSEALAEKCAASGMSQLLYKPIEARQLQAALLMLLEKKHPSRLAD